MPATQNQPSLTDNEGRRIHPSWANAGEIALAIMRGDHDEYLSQIQSAAAARVKGMWRKGTRVNIVGSKNADLAGVVGVILKVNQKTITVGFGEPTTDQWGTTYSHGEYNVPPAMLVKAA